MNVENRHPLPTRAAHSHTPETATAYRRLCWGHVIDLRRSRPACAQTRFAVMLAAVHPASVFGHEIEHAIGRTVTGQLARDPRQIAALRRLAVIANHEVTVDALRDTGLPSEIAIDLVRRLAARPPGWDVFERITSLPVLDLWAASVLERSEAPHVADDVLTLRVLQAFGHDVAVPWSFDVTNKWVRFYSAGPDEGRYLAHLLDIAMQERPNCPALRDICRAAYQAIARTHHGAEGQVWPHWEVRGDRWEIYPDPRNGVLSHDIVAHQAVTCETERWLRSVTPVGALEVSGCSPRIGERYESDISDTENVTFDPYRPRIAPRLLRERFAARAARAARQHTAATAAPSPTVEESPSRRSPPAWSHHSI
jgi:hypothetical protein